MVYHFNLYPLLARRVVNQASDLMELVEASFRVVAWVSIGVSLGLFVLSTDLMQLAFGSAFEAAAPAFRVLVWFLPVTLLSGHARWLLVAIKQQRLAFFAQAGGAAATVVVGLPLVALGGAFALDRSVGAAFGMLAAAVAVWVIAHRAAAKQLGSLPSVSMVIPPAALAAVIGLGASQVHWSAWITAPASGILFLALGPAIDRKLLSDLKLLLRSK
jgi:O-antigen/teichoic acid export membrane protein